MKKLLLTLAFVLAGIAPAFAQTKIIGVTMPTKTKLFTAAATNANCSLSVSSTGSSMLQTQGFGTVSFQVTGTLTGTTITFYGSMSGTTWNTILVTNVSSGAASTTTTATGTFTSTPNVPFVCAVATVFGGGDTPTVRSQATISGAALSIAFAPVYTADSFCFTGGQCFAGTVADVTTLSRSTNNQRLVLGLATALYPALVRSTTGFQVALGDGTAGGFMSAPFHLAGDGDSTNASYGFVSDPDTGMARINNGRIAFQLDGFRNVDLNGARVQWCSNSTHCFQMDYQIDNTVSVLSRAGTDAGILDVRTYSTSGAAGCSGAPTASTRGINTTCVDPSTVHLLTASEYQEFLEMRELFRALKSSAPSPIIVRL